MKYPLLSMNLKRVLKYSFVLIFCLSSTINVSNSQINTRSYIEDHGLVPREHNVDMKHMRLEVEFEPKKGGVKGKVTHYFTPLSQKTDSLYLDGPGIMVKEASLNGKPVKFKSDPKGITFFPAQPLTWGSNDSLSLVYEAFPRKGIYFIGWNDPADISRKQIWTQGQGIDNRHWFPCYDTQNDKLTTEVIVTFDSKYKVLSNGVKLLEKENGNGTKTWHYKMNHPHASYLVMLGIGDYEIKETKSKSGVPINLWYYPDWKNRVGAAYKYSEQMFEYMEKEFGVAYPWESYTQVPVQDFMYGAMENTTATIFGDFYFVDDRSFLDKNYVGVNAHELAHQWFGDYVTSRCDAHHWLHESFATHYHMSFEKEVFGKDYFDWARRAGNDAALKASLSDKNPIAHSMAGTVRVYPKGAVVLEMLKYVVGKEAFNRAMKYYLEKFPYKNVDSKDLLVAFHEALGISLDWFWEEWIYKGGEPHYSVSFREIKSGNEFFTEFDVLQTHEVSEVAGYFKMPVVFEVYYTDGTRETKREWIEDQHHTIKIPNIGQKKIDYVLFDPNSEVIKSVTFEKPFEMLKSQALKAKNMLDRYDAVVAMKNIPIEKKLPVLNELLDKEPFHAVKTEAIAQIITANTDATNKLVAKALNDKDAQVRKGVVQHTKNISPVLKHDYEKSLTDSSYETIVLALEKLSFDFPESIPYYLEKTKNVEGTKGRNVKIKWLEIAAAQDKKYAEELVNYTGNSYEFITRVTAMGALKNINYFSEKLLANSIDASFSANSRLSGPAFETIRYFYNQPANKKIILNYAISRQWNDWQQKIIDRIIN